MFSKILIANRGEIACRIMRTARHMGIATVAVYSEADRKALHVGMADEAICIGPAPAAQSYLSTKNIVDACIRTGAQALHPGYGFLSENAVFCAAVERAGVVFIGPDSATIRRAGNKIAAKKLAQHAGIETIAWSEAEIVDAEDAVRAANVLAYPVIVKAAAAGGGRGLRIAANDAQCRRAFAECRAEASAHFDDGSVFVEKLIPHARHVEVQVLADHDGNTLSLSDRECSIQRRHQKMVEEAPASALGDDAREALGRTAVRLARAIGYRSAGTVEFLCDHEGKFSFLEMNARLQVEHPVTEMITGIDLVEQMIRIAAGETLTLSQADVKTSGWAIEARVCTEDPARGFLPSAGRLVEYLPPSPAPGVRVDSGTFEGDTVSVHYDSMIAKVIAHAPTRREAIARLRLAVDDFRISGVSHNLAFLSSLTRHPRFLAGSVDTDFIDQEYVRKRGVIGPDRAHTPLLVCVAATMYAKHLSRAHNSDAPGEIAVTVLIEREPHAVRLAASEAGYTLRYGEGEHRLESGWTLGEPRFHGTLDGVAFCVQVERDGPAYRLAYAGVQCETLALDPRSAALYARMPRRTAAKPSGVLCSPMPGLLAAVAVQVGNEVKSGERLVVIEAMKMENVLTADHDCVIDDILVHAGASVAAGQPLIRFRQEAQ